MKTPFAVIALSWPVQLADCEISELTMKRPTVNDELKYAPSSSNLRTQMEEEARYFAHLCGISPEEVKSLDMEDYDKLQQQYLIFRGRAEASKGIEAGGGAAFTPGAHVAE